MEVQFQPRGEGWRTRGRPPRRCPEQLLTVLRQTYEQGVQATIPAEGSTRAEIAEVVACLKVGAAGLGLRLRIQAQGDAIRFYAEDKTDE